MAKVATQPARPFHVLGRLPGGALRSSGRFVACTLKSLRWGDTIGTLHLVFRKLYLGFLVFPRGSVACSTPSLFPFRFWVSLKYTLPVTHRVVTTHKNFLFP